MLSGEGNAGERWKTTIGLISKKATLHVQHTFFVHFFAVVLHDYNMKLPETSLLHVLWRKCRTCSYSLYLTRSFSPGWSLGFLIFSPPLKHFHVVLPTNSSLSSALALCRSFSRWASLACRRLYFSLYSKFVDMTINLSLIQRIQKQFPLSVFVFIGSLVVSTSKDACGYAISRQNNLELHLGCHTCWFSYFTLACLWCGPTVGRSVAVRSLDYQIFSER